MVCVQMKRDGAQRAGYLTITQELALLFSIPARRSAEVIAQRCVGLGLRGQ